MRIAIFSDVHSNLPALESLFNSLEKEKPDAAFCLGNLVGYNVWPNAVIDLIRKKGITTLLGPTDHMIGQKKEGFRRTLKTQTEKKLDKDSNEFTSTIIKKEQRNYLKDLPLTIRIEFQAKDEVICLLLSHGSNLIATDFYAEASNKEIIQHLNKAGVDIICTSHNYEPGRRILESKVSNKTHYKHIIFPGSTGRSMDGDPRGCYTIIDIGETASVKNPDSIKVEFIRFSYDVEKSAKSIEDSPLPDKLAQMLRSGSLG